MHLNAAGLAAARQQHNRPGARLSTSSRTATTAEIITAYLEAAGFTEEHEETPSGRRKRNGRTRIVGPWERS